MQYAIVAALTGDRSHQQAFRAALRERADLTSARLNAIPGITCVRAAGGVLRDAAGGAAAGQDRRGLRAGLLRATGILCVYGSGFGTPPEEGFFRIVFLASPGGAREIYDAHGGLHRRFLARMTALDAGRHRDRVQTLCQTPIRTATNR